MGFKVSVLWLDFLSLPQTCHASKSGCWKVCSSQSMVTPAVTHFSVKRPCNQQKTITASLSCSKRSIPASAHFLITYQVRGFIWKETHSNQSSHYTWLVCQHPNVLDWKCQVCPIQFYLINVYFAYVLFYFHIIIFLVLLFCPLIFSSTVNL